MTNRPRTRLLAGLGMTLALGVLLAGCEAEPRSERLAFPGGAGSAQARLTADVDGTPVLSWVEPDGEQDVLRYAFVEGRDLSEPHEVVRSERMFINWADFPSVTPISDELWFAHWLRLRPESRGAYDIAAQISTDGGESWSAAEQMNEDATEAEHGFVSVFDWDDQVAAFWLDGRELANWSFDEPDALLGTSLRLARYSDDGRVILRQITDALVCDCCQPDVAVSATGPIVIYRDRTETEIRDVVIRRYMDGAWTEPVDLGNENWHIEGCPVNGPVIAARGTEVAAAWFTAAQGLNRVRLARSEDAGASFSEPLDVDTRSALGQAAIVLDPDGRAIVSWWRRGDAGGIDLMVEAFAPDGERGGALRVAHETVGQPVDVPQLIAADAGYLIAWTTFEDEGTVRLARLSL